MQPQTPPYFAYTETHPKKIPFQQTIDEAVAKYIGRWHHDPDHVVVNPHRRDELGSEIESHGLRLDVLAHRIIAHNDVLVGVTDPAVTFFRKES